MTERASRRVSGTGKLGVGENLKIAKIKHGKKFNFFPCFILDLARDNSSYGAKYPERSITRCEVAWV